MPCAYAGQSDPQVAEKPFDEPVAFKELLGEIKLLRSDLTWVREKINTQTDNVSSLYDRVREVETAIARIEARQKPTVAWPAIVTIIISVAVAVLAVADRIYVNQ